VLCECLGGLLTKRRLIGDCLTKLSSSLLVILLFLLSAGTGSASVIYVEPGGSIQAAVNNSTTGDFIIVKAGDYQENVIVNVPGITVTSEPENPEGVLVRARDKNSSVFHLAADNITLRGFNVTGSGEYLSTQRTGFTNSSGSEQYSSDSYNDSESGKTYGSEPEIFVSRWDETGCPAAGICLENADNCTIEGNNVFENRYGIYLQESMNCTVSNNTFFRNGIWLDEGCSKDLLINNEIEEGSISIGAHCWDNIIFQNRLLNGEGISIACCGGNNLISSNEIINCSTGIDIYDVQARTFLRDNRITGCDYGIYLIFVFDSRVNNNTISNCTRGIFLKEDCHNNELANNTIISSNESGIYMQDSSSDNRIYNNYFNNTINVTVKNTNGNSWNTTKISGTNILVGSYLGGNFWANLNGTGFSQISNDTDADGICDLPYNINGSDFDYLPLAKPPTSAGVELIVTIGPPEGSEMDEVSIEISRGILDFGNLSAGSSSNSQVLNIRNTGKSDVRISAEIRDPSDPVFSEGIYLSSIFWPDFSEVIVKNTTKDIEVILKVPANYSENGIKKGSLIFRAEKI
jgi:parallel beta-helix repeat protein